MSSTQGKRQKKASRHDNMIGRKLQNGKYQIESVLGHGGMGQVFLATYTKLDNPVALKQVRGDQPLPESVIEELDDLLYHKTATPQGRYKAQPLHISLLDNDFPVTGGANTDRFLREALLLARLHHPALPRLFDYFFEDGYWYLVMEYIPGPTLAIYIRQHAPLPPLEAINYAMQLCDVLDYFHQQTPPVIFRDLKPSNIILNPDGRLMLVDFGIARYFKTGQINDTTDFGSPGYASPEQHQGLGQTDARSDLFSLGVILHEMLSGQRPTSNPGNRSDSDQFQLLHQINPDISPVLIALVSIATRSEPAQRFQSASNMYQALERARRVEERRAYYRHITQNALPTDSVPATPQHTETAPRARAGSSPGQGQATAPTYQALQETQSLPVRESQDEGHREQLEQEALQIQLASIDESLKQRPLPSAAPTSFTPTPLSLRSVRKTSRILYICLVLILLPTLILASLFSYHHFFSATKIVTRGHQATATPKPTPTVSSSWQILPSFLSPEGDNTATYVQLQNKAYIYMTGGFRGLKNIPHYDHNLYRYDIGAAHWETVMTSNFPGMVNNAVALDEHNNLFYTVGYSSDIYAVTSLLYMYSPASGKLQKIIPPPQMPIGFGSAIIADQQGHLYISQGFMIAGHPEATAGRGWYRYDINTGQWHQLASLPLGLGYIILAPDNHGGILMLTGSHDAGQHEPTSQIYRYDITQNTWTLEQATSPSALSGTASCLDQHGHIVIIGGYDPIHNVTLAQTWLVNLQTLQWQPLPPLPQGGSFLGAAACDGKGHVYLVRGANNLVRPTTDFLILTLPS